MSSSEAAESGKARRAAEIARILGTQYPNLRPHLDYRSPFELLVATILAAQCTDEAVNKVTPELFRRWPDASALAAADPGELEEVIHSTGFYRNKARSLLGMARGLVEQFSGKLPRKVDELTRLPGVGRKTANVIAAHCFGVPAIIVDTHVKRLAGRLELSAHTDPDKIEVELAALLPAAQHTGFSQALNEHGRRVCTARKPSCGQCLIARLCPYPARAGL